MKCTTLTIHKILLATLGIALSSLALYSFVYSQTVPVTIDEKPVTASESSPYGDGLLYTVIDEYTDEATEPDGTKIMKIYKNPRQIYEDGGVKKVRPEGWNVFAQSEKSRLQKKEKKISKVAKSIKKIFPSATTPSYEPGYSYSVEVEGGKVIGVTSGGYERYSADGTVVFKQAPLIPDFLQYKHTGADISYYNNIYTGADILFKDITSRRFRQIIFREKPAGIKEKETLVFWEEFTLPDGVSVERENGEVISKETKLVGEDVYITFPSGEVFMIGRAMVNDKPENEFDFGAVPLVYRVRVHGVTHTLSIGVELPSDYLLAKERTYPVVIDPVLQYCSTTTCVTDMHLREPEASPNTSDHSLFLGLWNNAGTYVIRHPLVKFNADFPALGRSYTLTSAHMFLTRDARTGFGTYRGSVNVIAQKVEASWSSDSVRYSDLRNSLTPVGDSESVAFNYNLTYFWDISSAAREWMTGSWPNHGILLEETPVWSSGAKPSWPDYLYSFYASEGSALEGPYLSLTLEPKPESKPDLYFRSFAVSNNRPTQGDTITIYGEVLNQGAGSSGAHEAWIYYWDVVGVQWVKFNDSCSVPSLAPGASFTCHWNVFYPADYPPSTSYLSAYVDVYNVVDESNETNNSPSSYLTVYVQPKVVVVNPDFVPSGYSILNPSSTYIGGYQMTLRGTISNTGAATSGVQYSLKLKNTSTGALYDLSNVSPSTITVNANSSAVYDLQGTIPSDCGFPLEGTYQVIVNIDPNNSIAETNDSNNTILSSNTAVVSRGYYCGGGGGGGGGGSTPAPDLDGDSFSDLEEKYAGTSEKAVDARSIFDPNYKNHSTTITDVKAENTGGDPVNTRTGAFEFSQTDFSLPGRGVSINYVRTYNSKLPERNNRLGYGWNSSYNIYYYKDPTTKNIQVYLGGALVAMFTTSDGGVTYTAPPGEDHTFISVGTSWEYKTLEGIKYKFSKTVSDNLGMIEFIIDRNNNQTSFYYTTVKGVPLLQRIEDASSRSMRFVYGAEDSDLWDKIVHVEENANNASVWVRRATYQYTTGNLTKVTEFYDKRGVTQSREHLFTYDADHRLLTYTDPRLTIVRSEYDTEGKTIKQYETKSGSAERLIFQFVYTGANADVPGSVACTTTKNFRNATVLYQTTECFNDKALKLYKADGSGIVVER